MCTIRMSQDFARNGSQGRSSENCECPGLLWGESGEPEGRGALEGYRESRRVRRAATINAGYRRKQTKRGDESDKQKRQNSNELGMVGALNMQGQQQDQGDPDREYRNHEPN